VDCAGWVGLVASETGVMEGPGPGKRQPYGNVRSNTEHHRKLCASGRWKAIEQIAAEISSASLLDNHGLRRRQSLWMVDFQREKDAEDCSLGNPGGGAKAYRTTVLFNDAARDPEAGDERGVRTNECTVCSSRRKKR
jgi:hypothetical protein